MFKFEARKLLSSLKFDQFKIVRKSPLDMFLTNGNQMGYLAC